MTHKDGTTDTIPLGALADGTLEVRFDGLSATLTSDGETKTVPVSAAFSEDDTTFLLNCPSGTARRHADYFTPCRPYHYHPND